MLAYMYILCIYNTYCIRGAGCTKRQVQNDGLGSKLYTVAPHRYARRGEMQPMMVKFNTKGNKIVTKMSEKPQQLHTQAVQ